MSEGDKLDGGDSSSNLEGMSTEELVLKYKSMGNDAFTDRQFATAIDYFTRGIALDSTNHFLYSNRSAAFLCADDYEAALRDAEEVLRLKPEWAKGYMRKGHALLRLGQPRLARSCFEKGLSLEPSNTDFRDNLALCDEAEAEQAANGTLPPDTSTPNRSDHSSAPPVPSVARDSDGAGSVHSQSGVAAMASPAVPPSPSGSASANVASSRFVESPPASGGSGAIPERVVSPPPSSTTPPLAQPSPPPSSHSAQPVAEDSTHGGVSSSEHHKHLGNDAFAHGQYEDAVRHFTLALSSDPTNHVLYSNRSAAYASLSDYAAALRDAEKTVELQPNWAKGYARRGLAQFHLHRYDEALATYEAGLQVEPGNQLLEDARLLCVAKLKGESAPASQGSVHHHDSSPGRMVASPAGTPDGDGRQEVTYKDGLRYIGDFKNNRFHGNGQCYWPDGSAYTGEFARGIKHGFGTFEWPTGHKYRGMYSNDKKHGKGSFEWPDGGTYEGEFYHGVQQGVGTKTDPDGTSYHGDFVNDQMHGRGVTTYPDGTQSDDTYEHGKRVTSVTTLDTEPGSRNALPAGAELIIVGTAGSLTGREIRVRRPLVSIGSVKVATLRVTGDTSLSSLHAVLAFDDERGTFNLCDLNSSNGTLLNSRPISRPPPPSGPGVTTAPVSKGDIVVIGENEIEIGDRIMETGKSGKLEPIGLHLNVLTGPHRGRQIEIFKYASLGSASDNEVAIPSAEVSPFHAILFSRQGEYYCKDLNSARGTVVSGQLLGGPAFFSPPAALKRNDILSLGASQFRVLNVSEPHDRVGGRDSRDPRRVSGGHSYRDDHSPHRAPHQHQQQHHHQPRHHEPATQQPPPQQPHRESLQPQPPRTVASAEQRRQSSQPSPAAGPRHRPGQPVPLEQLLVDFREWALSVVFQMFDSSDHIVRKNANQLMSLALIIESVAASRGVLNRPARDVCQHILEEYLTQYGCRFPMTPLAVGGDVVQREYESKAWVTRRRTVEDGTDDMDTVDAFLSDLDGQDFWRDNFGSSVRVSVGDFLHSFRKHFSDLEGDLRDVEHGLRLMLDWNRDDEVSLYEFDVFLRRFGPFKKCAATAVDCLGQSWFHRVYTNNTDVQRMLAGQPRGSFFVRFCMSDVRQFLLCYQQDGHVQFDTIECVRDGYRIVPATGTSSSSEAGTVYARMSELVASKHHIARIPVPDPAIAHRTDTGRRGPRGRRESEEEYDRYDRSRGHRHHHHRGPRGSHDVYGREVRYDYGPDEMIYDSARHRPSTQPFAHPGAAGAPVRVSGVGASGHSPQGSQGRVINPVPGAQVRQPGHTPHPGAGIPGGARTVGQPGVPGAGHYMTAPGGYPGQHPGAGGAHGGRAYTRY